MPTLNTASGTLRNVSAGSNLVEKLLTYMMERPAQTLECILKSEKISIHKSPYTNVPRIAPFQTFDFYERFILVQDAAGIYKPIGCRTYVDHREGPLWPVLNYNSAAGRSAMDSWDYVRLKSLTKV